MKRCAEEADLFDYVSSLPIHSEQAPSDEPALGMKITDNYFVVKGIQEKDEIPREDGHAWNAWERMPRNEATRPYNREYMTDQEERMRILNEHPDYRFIKAIAGALKKGVVELFESEDLARIMAEREDERRRKRLEENRAIVSMEEKAKSIERLESQRAKLARQVEDIRRRLPAPGLERRSKFLIEVAGNPNHGLVSLLVQQDKYTRVLSASSDADIPSGVVMEKTLSMSASARRLSLFVRYFLDVSKDFISTVENRVRESGAVISDELVTMLDDERILTGERKWHEESEVIRLAYFDALGISKEEEKEMMMTGCDAAYFVDYCRVIVEFITVDGDERAFMQTENGGGVDIYNTKKKFHPESVTTLLRRELGENWNAIETRSNAQANNIAFILRSHLLYHYFLVYDMFDEVPDIALVNSVAQEIEEHTDVRMLLQRYQKIITEAISVYKESATAYFMQLLDYFNSQPGVLYLPDGLTDSRDYTGHDFDALNQLVPLLKSPMQLVNDELFAQYLTTGRKAYLTNAEKIYVNPVNPISGWENMRYLEIPLLIIHTLFVAYVRYIRDYSRVVQTQRDETEVAIRNAGAIMNRVIGNEDGSAETRARPAYKQRLAYVSRPANSGIVQLRDEIAELIRKTYFRVIKHCPKLSTYEMEEFQSNEAFQSGLTSAFVEYLAVLSFFDNMMAEGTYKSMHLQQLITLNLSDKLRRLREYKAPVHGVKRPRLLMF